MYDLIIKNGLIIDGTGSDAYISDIGIIGEKISSISKEITEESKVVIDAKGKFVTPGFIDPHSHAEMNVLFYNKCQSLVFQGVTTFVGGNCGGSAAPVGKYWDTKIMDLSKLKGVNPSYYTWFDTPLKTEDAVTQIKEVYGLDVSYKTLEDFCKKTEELGISANYYPLIGHGSIRDLVMNGEARNATEEEIERMKDLLEQAILEGANGMSTGLDYPPGAYSTTEELVELGKVLKKHEGVYATHFRGRKLFTTGEGGFDPEGGLREALEISKKADIPVHISHVVPNKTVEEIIEQYDDAIRNGYKVTFDVISNTSGGGGTFVYLAFLVKPWYLAAGTIEQFVKNLNEADYCSDMKRTMKDSKWYFANDVALPGIEKGVLVTESTNKNYIDKTLAEIMAEHKWDYYDCLINILREDPLTKIKYGIDGDEENENIVLKLLQHKLAMPCSDGYAFDDKARMGHSTPLDFLPHQNSYCYMIKYLMKYKSERIEDTIRKATGYVAEVFKIKQRGTLVGNNYADIVIFNPDNLKTNESIYETRNYPSGIDYCIVNGKITSKDGEHTGELAGKVLRRK